MAVTSVGTGDTPNEGRTVWNANDTELEGKIDGHTADTVDAHDASAISFTPTGSIASTDVQGAIAEVASEAGGGGAADASTTVKGISKTSVAPASSTNPIAVGDNDPRVTADQAAGTASIRTLGTGAVQAATGNHTHAGGSGPPFSDSLALVQDNIDSTKKMNIECTDIATGQWRTLRMPNADTDLGALTHNNIAAANKDGVAGTASMRTLGTGAQQAAAGNDSRFPSTPPDNADYKQSVRAATTAAGTLASSFENGDAIDGVTLATGNRILIKNQATGSENGIYTVNASGAPTRATDADTSAKVTPQLFVRAEEGTANGGKAFVLTNTGTVTLGTTALTFAENTPTPAAHAPSHNPGGSDVPQRFQTIYWVFDGTLAVTTGNKQVPIFIPTGSNTPTLVSAAARITTAPTGSAVTFDLNKGGTTVWTGGTNRLTVAASANSGSTTTFDVSTFASLDYFTVDIDTVGSATAGIHAVFALTYRY